MCGLCIHTQTNLIYPKSREANEEEDVKNKIKARKLNNLPQGFTKSNFCLGALQVDGVKLQHTATMSSIHNCIIHSNPLKFGH